MQELRNRAKDVLVTRALAKAEQEDGAAADDLVTLGGMNDALLAAFKQAGIASREALADLATDELLELVPMDEKLAAALIMEARGFGAQQV